MFKSFFPNMDTKTRMRPIDKQNDRFRSDFNRIFKTVGGTQCFFSKELTCNYIIHEHNIVNVSQA